VSASPGPVRLWPYQRAIADAIADPLIERITLVKPDERDARPHERAGAGQRWRRRRAA
jgi:hypothetical protein